MGGWLRRWWLRIGLWRLERTKEQVKWVNMERLKVVPVVAVAELTWPSIQQVGKTPATSAKSNVGQATVGLPQMPRLSEINSTLSPVACLLARHLLLRSQLQFIGQFGPKKAGYSSSSNARSILNRCESCGDKNAKYSWSSQRNSPCDCQERRKREKDAEPESWHVIILSSK